MGLEFVFLFMPLLVLFLLVLVYRFGLELVFELGSVFGLVLV